MMKKFVFAAAVLFALASPATGAERMIVLAMGQSNMTGTGAGGPQPQIPPSLRIWSEASSRWLQAQWGSTPLRNSEAGHHNSIAVQFALRALSRGETSVDLFVIARGRQPIARWIEDGVHSVMYARATAALTAAGNPRVDVVLWHQGEGDRRRSVADYAADYIRLIGQLRTDPRTRDAILVMGELGYTACQDVTRGTRCSQQNGFFSYYRQFVNDPRVTMAPAIGLPMLDDHHFTGGGLAMLGRRMHQRYERLARELRL